MHDSKILFMPFALNVPRGRSGESVSAIRRFPWRLLPEDIFRRDARWKTARANNLQASGVLTHKDRSSQTVIRDD